MESVDQKARSEHQDLQVRKVIEEEEVEEVIGA